MSLPVHSTASKKRHSRNFVYWKKRKNVPRVQHESSNAKSQHSSGEKVKWEKGEFFRISFLVYYANEVLL